MRKQRSPVSLLLFLVFAFLVGGRWGIAKQGSNEPLSTFSPSPLLATPTVNFDHAWETCKAGGELTYEEVIALRPAFATNQNFSRMLEKCKLKETIGWVSSWSNEGGYEHTIFPNKNLVAVHVYNPFSGSGKDLTGQPEMYLVYFSDEEVAQLRDGQRIKFSGDLVLVERPAATVAVENPKYTLLEDEPAVPRPTADELKDLEIRLDRTICYGRCPDYTLTITADGKVTFEGRNDTMVKGTVTTTIDKAKLEELAREIKKVDFFGLLDEYPLGITRYPTYTLSI